MVFHSDYGLLTTAFSPVRFGLIESNGRTAGNPSGQDGRNLQRLVGAIRRGYLDRTLFWTTVDLETKLLDSRITSTGIAACFTAGTNTRTRREWMEAVCGSPFLPMAVPLPGSLSDTHRRLIVREAPSLLHAANPAKQLHAETILCIGLCRRFTDYVSLH